MNSFKRIARLLASVLAMVVNPAALGSVAWNGVNDYVINFTGTSSDLANLVNAWANPSANAGLLLRNDMGGAAGSASVLSSEASVPVPSWRPTLTIGYTAVPEPSTWAMVVLGLGGFLFAAKSKRMV